MCFIKQRGYAELAKGVGRIAAVVNNPVTLTISAVSGIAMIFDYCECKK